MKSIKTTQYDVVSRSKRKDLKIAAIVIGLIMAIAGFVLCVTWPSLSSRIQSRIKNTVINYRELSPEKMISSKEDMEFVDYQYDATFQLDSSSIKLFSESNPLSACTPEAQCEKTAQEDFVSWSYTNHSENISISLTADLEKKQVHWSYLAY